MARTKRRLKSVPDPTPQLRFATIHGYRRAFRIAGHGPTLILIHGVGDNSTTWQTVHSSLARRFTVIAPDLLGTVSRINPGRTIRLPPTRTGCAIC